jgi:hypothetical protein
VREADVVSTSRNEALIYTVIAKIALERLLVVFVETYGIVRAGFHAALTSCAHILVEDYDAVFPLRYSLFRASFSTWRVVAVPTHRGTVNIFQLFPNHLRSIFLDVNELDLVVVFLFAGHFASSAPPAQFMIYNERMLVHCFCLLQAFSR